jgi:hypothetical protein
MDPELELFLRRPAKQLKLQHSATLDDTITSLAVSSSGLLAVAQVACNWAHSFNGDPTMYLLLHAAVTADCLADLPT